MLAARGPLGLCSTSYCTLSFSLSVLKPLAWIDEKCTKRSLLPSSGVMKPNPLASLNHFTVPVLTVSSFLRVEKGEIACGRQGGNERRRAGTNCYEPGRLSLLAILPHPYTGIG